MKICILGAGAIGGHIAYRLAAAGHDVSVLARGAHLEAMRRRGQLGFTEGGDVAYAPVRASDDPADFGPQDAVIVGVKATGLLAMADLLGPVVGPDTLVYFPQNGMTWWYPLSDEPLPYELPDLAVFRLKDRFLSMLEPHQIAAGTVYSGNAVQEAGVIFNSSPGKNSLTIAAIDQAGREAAERLRAAIDASGLGASTPDNLRTAMWAKLVQNMSGSVIALATRNQTAICREDPRLGELYIRIMTEGKEIAAAWGHPVGIEPADALSRAPSHFPSLLQDFMQGRPMEIGEIVLAPAAFARAAGVPCPSLDAVAGIVARLAIDKGLYAE